MSIELMSNVVMLIPSKERDRFIEWLYEIRELHLEDFEEASESWSDRFSSSERDSSTAELNTSRLQASLDFLSEIHKTPSDFLEGLFPVKIVSSKNEIENAVSSVNPEELLFTCQKFQTKIESLRDKINSLTIERSRLSDLDFIHPEIGRIKNLKNTSLHIISVSGTQKSFINDERLSEEILVYPVSVSGTSTTYILSAPLAFEQTLLEVMNDFGLHETSLPDGNGKISDEIVKIDSLIKVTEETLANAVAEAVDISKEFSRKAELALAYWESERVRSVQQGYMMSSNSMFAIKGYLKTGKIEEFKSKMVEAFPNAELETIDLTPDKEPPVSVTWNNFFRPAGLLVKMFGLPSYRGIDPTVYLTATFFTFFGICYGDVLYGLMLIFLAGWLKKRFRDQQHLVQFFRLFTYAGYSTVFFGFLVGSWGADLPAYFGAGNIVDTIRMKLCLLDPLVKPVVALGVAVGIGVFNQFYGIFMRFLRDFRRGDVASSIYDGIFWITYLGSLIILSLALAGMFPKVVVAVSGIVLAASALGLILTQGREEKNWIARIFTGLISLYGIMGTYGTTAFIGDVISYSRLMALGMTTSVVGMSFNIIAGMVKDVPYVGFIFFIIIVIFGHIFNFSMSIMSAFVHSARLILLEWFGRFYEGGGTPFTPFGFNSSKIDIVESN